MAWGVRSITWGLLWASIGACAPARPPLVARTLDGEVVLGPAISATTYERFLVGELAMARGDAAGARDAFMAAEPELHPRVLARLVEAEAATGQLDEARERLARGLETHPRSAALHSCLARLAAASGQTEEALVAYRLAATLAPADVRPVLEAAELARSAGKMAAARAIVESHLERAERADPRVLVLGLELALDAGAPPAALSALAARLHNVAPRHDGDIRRWATARLEAGRPADALALLEALPRERGDLAPYLAARAAVDGPDDALRALAAMSDALVGGDLERGQLALQLGDVALAITLAEAALTEAPEPRARLLLGQAQRADGRPRDALTTLAQIPVGVSVRDEAEAAIASARDELDDRPQARPQD